MESPHTPNHSLATVARRFVQAEFDYVTHICSRLVLEQRWLNRLQLRGWFLVPPHGGLARDRCNLLVCLVTCPAGAVRVWARA